MEGGRQGKENSHWKEGIVKKIWDTLPDWKVFRENVDLEKFIILQKLVVWSILRVLKIKPSNPL